MKAIPPQSLLVVVSGPSGAGKGEALAVLAKAGLSRVVTYTTRQPRSGEIDGVDYNFISEDELRRLYDQGYFFEYNRTYNKDVYASPTDVLQADSSTKGQVMELDPEGFFYVRANARRNVIGIFTLPPSIEELDRRIRNRAKSSDDDVKRRITIARKQIIMAWQYDYVITNTDLDKFRNDVSDVARVILNNQKSAGDLGELVAKIRNSELAGEVSPDRDIN